jgi:hypothetical protein
LRDRIEAVAALRRELSLGPVVPDYSFIENGNCVHLSELFAAQKPYLIVYRNRAARAAGQRRARRVRKRDGARLWISSSAPMAYIRALVNWCSVRKLALRVLEEKTRNGI